MTVQCDHPNVSANNGSARLECRCPCAKCFNSAAPIGERCMAFLHCTTHFKDGVRR